MARPLAHLAVTAGVAAFQLARTRRLLPAAAPFLTGFLIDADHLVDYVLYRASGKGTPERLILALHGWEYLLPLAWLEARWLGARTAHGLTLGMLVHLALDQLTNDTTEPLAYSVGWRAARRFRGRFFGGRAGQHSWRDTPVAQLWRWL